MVSDRGSVSREDRLALASGRTRWSPLALGSLALVIALETRPARAKPAQPRPDRLEIRDELLVGVLQDPSHEFTYEQMEALVEMAARERTHMYNLFAGVALALAEHDVSATVSGDIMRALLDEYDLSGEDGAACFASERHERIRLGRSLRDPKKVEIVFTMSERGRTWVKDVPEKYTLALAKEWGFADVSEGELGEMFGIRGGWSFFTFRMETYGLVEGGTMTMKFRVSRAIPVEVHRIRRR